MKNGTENTTQPPQDHSSIIHGHHELYAKRKMEMDRMIRLVNDFSKYIHPSDLTNVLPYTSPMDT